MIWVDNEMHGMRQNWHCDSAWWEYDNDSDRLSAATVDKPGTIAVWMVTRLESLVLVVTGPQMKKPMMHENRTAYLHGIWTGCHIELITGHDAALNKLNSESDKNKTSLTPIPMSVMILLWCWRLKPTLSLSLVLSTPGINVENSCGWVVEALMNALPSS
jgi:hypothetical protein